MLDQATGEALPAFVFVVAIPMLMLRVLATADFSGLSAWRLWPPFFGRLHAVVDRRRADDPPVVRPRRAAGLVAGLAAGYGNTTLVGIPLTLAAYGAAGSLPMALIIAVQMPLMMAATALLMERAEGRMASPAASAAWRR